MRCFVGKERLETEIVVVARRELRERVKTRGVVAAAVAIVVG